MKKALMRTFAVLIAVLMFCIPALGEAALSGATQTFTDKEGRYTFEAPDDWYMVDGDTILSIVQEMVKSGQVSEDDMNSTLQELVAQADSVDAFYYASDWVGNMNLITEPAQIADYGAVYDAMIAALEQQYTQMGFTLNSTELVQFNGVNFINVNVTFMGTDMEQYFGAIDGIAFTFTFTGEAIDGAETVLSSIDVK